MNEKEIKQKIKRHLWQRGLRAQDIPAGLENNDILVEGKYRVKIVKDINEKIDGCDAVATVEVKEYSIARYRDKKGQKDIKKIFR